MDKTASIHSGASLTSGLLLSQAKSVTKGTDRSLESVLQSSKQKVTAIESMLRGFNVSGKGQSSSLDLGVDSPSSRDPPFPLAVPASNSLTNSLEDTISAISKIDCCNGSLALSDIITQFQGSKDLGKFPHHISVGNESFPPHSSYLELAKRTSEKELERGVIEENVVSREPRKYTNSHVDKQFSDTLYKDSNYIPNFQRPLLRKNAAGRMSAGRRSSFDDSQISLGDVSSHADGPASLNDALTGGLSSSSDWNARMAAFNYVHYLLKQGPKGIQEVIQYFEKVMKLFLQHLDDPHYKVAQAALTTLADLIPACRKPFENYMERVLPHVFSRLIDPKELVRQPCSTTLDLVGKIFGTDALLPALLRSLDEQRSPKAKLAVIEFAMSSFNKHASNSEGSANSDILKLWLAKLTPLGHDKNIKLKEAAITCIISVYTHYDSVAVLNFILSLSVEEQNSLIRALKQYTPRIEVDLINFLQSKKEKRSKYSFDPTDVVGTSSEEGYTGASKKSNQFGRYSSGSVDGEGDRKLVPLQDASCITEFNGNLKSDDDILHNVLGANTNADVPFSNRKNMNYVCSIFHDNSGTNSNTEISSASCLEFSGLNGSDDLPKSADFGIDSLPLSELTKNHLNLPALNMNFAGERGPIIPQILHVICDGNGESSAVNKSVALQQLVEVSILNDHSVWSKVIVPMLVTEDERTLVTCINCLTKLVGKLSQEELMGQLPSFLPSLFDAFGSQSADVRKTVVFRLVDVYIMLGKAFLPYLEGLNSTQLRLVTIYANRISQARTGVLIDTSE